MRNNTTTADRNFGTELWVVKGNLIEPSERLKLVDSAWNFAYSALWNASIFSTKEISLAKENIQQYFILAKNKRKAFVSFCERILLARYYVNGAKGRYIPLPSLWFDRDNLNGFVGTKEWLIEIKNIRSLLPGYKQETKALAEAVLEFSEEPTIQNFQYWRRYFIDRETPGLLNLFQVTAIQQLCN
jgi:hypothetical protein